MMLADSEDVEPDLIGVLDLLDQVAKAFRFTDRAARLVVRSREAVNSDFHWWPLLHA